ncbi:DUF1652 domain-containing protein [Pseudomonas sp. QTF5]|uniref:DUF1652 domain-containing protein n=1 Tax=Pseudomonas sp. QTF5 TaxID=1435425 RepID=UPI0035326AA9
MGGVRSAGCQIGVNWSFPAPAGKGVSILNRWESADSKDKIDDHPFELRHLIECSFLPPSGSCTVNPDGSLTIKIFDPIAGCVELLVTGVSTANLVSSQRLPVWLTN